MVDLRIGLVLVLVVAACGGEDPKKYASYQECFDDKTEKQMKTPVEGIVQCCLDHDIGGAKPPHCGADQPACINYLTANVSQTDADITVKTEGCSAYVAELSMQ